MAGLTQSVNPASASSGNNNPIGLAFQYKPTPAGGNFQRPSLMSCVAGMSFGGLIYQHVQIDISDRFERPALITYSRLFFIKPFTIFLCPSKKGRIAFRIKKQAQSLHDTRTKHTLLILFASTQSALRIRKTPTTYTPIIGFVFFISTPL